MAKQGEALFEESSQGAVSAITALVVVLSFALLMGGLVLMSYGFDDGGSLWVFTAGLVATLIGFALPFTLLPATGK